MLRICLINFWLQYLYSSLNNFTFCQALIITRTLKNIFKVKANTYTILTPKTRRY